MTIYMKKLLAAGLLVATSTGAFAGHTGGAVYHPCDPWEKRLEDVVPYPYPPRDPTCDDYYKNKLVLAAVDYTDPKQYNPQNDPKIDDGYKDNQKYNRERQEREERERNDQEFSVHNNGTVKDCTPSGCQ